MTQNNVIPFPSRKLENNDSVDPSTKSNQQEPRPEIFVLQAYVPAGIRLAFLETHGTHQIPHKLFEFMVKVSETKLELAVLACLIRYTLGFHRFRCEASLRFIRDWTGLPKTSVRRGLDSLLSKRLIVEIEGGISIEEPTIYEVPVIKGYLLSGEGDPNPRQERTSKKREETSGSNSDSDNQPDHSLYSKRVPPGTQNDYGSLQDEYSSVLNLSTKKENSNKTLNKPLSQTDELPEVLKTYFLNLNPKNKKEREFKHFQSLRNSHSLEAISQALKHLLEKGIPGSGEICHSPMAFLSYAIARVLTQVSTLSEKAKQRDQRESETANRKLQKEKEEAMEEARCAEGRRLFQEAFPTPSLQNTYFKEFVEKFPIFAGNPYSLKEAAISFWNSNRK